jgi:hypothetical protein
MSITEMKQAQAKIMAARVCHLSATKTLLEEADELLRTAIQEAEAFVPVAWLHDCAALLQNDVEFWIDSCPHCGKPKPHPPTAPAQQDIDLLIKNAKLTAAHLRTFDVATANLVEMMTKELELKSSSYKTLYTAINNLLCHIGYEGSIDADHAFVWSAMCALKAIDGGIYGEQFAAAQPAKALETALQERDETIKDLRALIRAQAHFLKEDHDELNGKAAK